MCKKNFFTSSFVINLYSTTHSRKRAHVSSSIRTSYTYTRRDRTRNAHEMTPGPPDTRAGKLAADVLSIDLITIKVLTSLRGYERYKAIFSFMALGLLSRADADALFLGPAKIQFGPGGLKALMQTCSAVLKLIRYEYGWLFCERSEDVLRHSVLAPDRAWATLMHVVQIGLDASVVNAMIASYNIDITVNVPYSLVRPEIPVLRPDLAMIDHALLIGDFRVADVLIRHGASPTVAVLCHMSSVETPKLHPFDDDHVLYDRVVDYLVSRGVSLDGPIGGESRVADTNVLGFIAYASSRVTDASPLLVARAVLARGADVNAPGCQGLPPVLWAIRYWNLPLTQLLLDHGAVIPATLSPDGVVDVPSSHLIYSELVTPSFVTEDCTEIDATLPFEVLKLMVEQRVDINSSGGGTCNALTRVLYGVYRDGVADTGNVGVGVEMDKPIAYQYRKCAHELCELIMRHIM